MSPLNTTVVAPARMPITRLFVTLATKVVEWDRRYRAKCHIAQLDERLLHDVGLHRADLKNAVRKPTYRD